MSDDIQIVEHEGTLEEFQEKMREMRDRAGALAEGYTLPPRQDGCASRSPAVHAELLELVGGFLDVELERQQHPIGWSGTASALYETMERYKHYWRHPSERNGAITHEQAAADVMEVLCARLLRYAENGIYGADYEATRAQRKQRVARYVSG